MGIIETVRNVAEDAAEATGLEDEVDKAEDAVQKATGVDLGGSGGGKEDEDVKKQGSEDPAVSDPDGGTGGDKATGTSSFDNSGGSDSPTTSSSGGSDFDSGGDDDDDGGGGSPAPSSQGGKPSPEQIRKQLGLTTPKEKRKRQKKQLRKLEEKQARDPDIVQPKKFAQGKAKTLFESGAAQALSEGRTAQGLDRIRTQRFFKARQRRQKAEKNIQQLNQQLEKLRETNAEKLVLRNSETGTKKIVSKSKAIENLKSTKKKLKEDVKTIESRQIERIERINQEPKTISREKKVEKEARKADLDDLKVKAFGQTFKGSVAKGAAFFDAFTTGGTSGDLVASLAPGGKTPSQVAKERVVSENLEKNKKFNAVEEAKETLTSVPGIVGTTLVGGAAFQGAVKSVSGVSTLAGRGLLRAGQAAGAATVAKQGLKAKKEFERGEKTEAGGTLVETAAGIYGFAKGSRAFSKRFGPRLGSTEITQRNTLFKQGNKELSGFGKLRGKTKVVRPRALDVVRRKVPGLTEKGPVVETVRSRGRFGIEAGRTGSEAQGRLTTELPSGKTRSRTFEALSNVRRTGTTQSGKRFVETSDIVRTQGETRLFRFTRDLSSKTRTLRQSREPVKGALEGTRVRLSSASRRGGSDTFTDTTNLIIGRSGGTGGAGSGRGVSSTGSGGGGVTASKSGTGLSGTTRAPSVRSLVRSQAKTRVSELNPKGRTGAGASSGSKKRRFTVGSEQNAQSLTRTADLQTEVSQRQRQGNRQKTQSGTQKKRTTEKGNIQISEGSGTGSITERVKDLKDSIRTGVTDFGRTQGREKLRESAGLETGQKSRNKLRQQNRNIEELSNIQGLETGLTQLSGTRNLEKLKLKELQKTKTRQLQKLATPTTVVTTKLRVPGSAAPIPLNLGGQGRGRLRRVSSVRDLRQGVREGVKLDFLSANLVEQETKNEAIFPVPTSEDKTDNTKQIISGLATVQERTGKVSKPKAFKQVKNIV